MYCGAKLQKLSIKIEKYKKKIRLFTNFINPVIRFYRKSGSEVLIRNMDNLHLVDFLNACKQLSECR